MMKSKRLLIVLCVITLMAGVLSALAWDIPIGSTGTQTAGMAVRSGRVTDTVITSPLVTQVPHVLAANDAQTSPLPSPLIGDEPVDSGGSTISTGAVIAVALAVLLLIALVIIRLWKKRPPGRSGQDIP